MEVATHVFLNNGLRAPQWPESTLVGDVNEKGINKSTLSQETCIKIPNYAKKDIFVKIMH